MPNNTTPAPNASNVVPLQARLLGLGWATTGGLGDLVSGSRNEIWHCHGYEQSGQGVMLYVKVGLSTRAMLVEALAAQIAAAIGLKSPPAYLCQVQSHHVGRPRGGRMLAFASAVAGERGLARPLRNLEALLSILSSAKVADLACAFDEWLCNEVRSPSDILVCPELGPIFIDHEAALPNGVDPGASLVNWLAGRLLQGLSARERQQLLDRLRKRSAALHRLRLDDVPGVLAICQDGGPLYAQLVQFLQHRLAHLDRLLSERVMPEQRYLTALPETPPETDHATV